MTAGTRLAGLVLLALLFLGVAFWNHFPLVFYDTGAYMAEGLEGAFFVERSPVYSLLLPLTGAFFSLWWTAAAQAHDRLDLRRSRHQVERLDVVGRPAVLAEDREIAGEARRSAADVDQRRRPELDEQLPRAVAEPLARRVDDHDVGRAELRVNLGGDVARVGRDRGQA